MGGGISKNSYFKSLERRFSTEELFTLRQTFTELSSRNSGNFIDRDTFKSVFRMPGVLSDRLFNAFDLNHSDMVDYESFITGLALFVRGNFDERIDFLFRIYDIEQNGRITKEGLTTVLNSVLFAGYLIISTQSDPERISDAVSEIISNRTKKLVDDAFRFQEKNALTKEQFRRWAEDNSVEVEYALDVLIRDRNTLGRRSIFLKSESSCEMGRLTFDGILRTRPRSCSLSRNIDASQSNSSFAAAQSGSFQDTYDPGRPVIGRPVIRRPNMKEFIDKPGVHITCKSCDYDISACYCAYCGSALKIRNCTLSCPFCISENRFVQCLFCTNCGSDLRPSLLGDGESEPIFGEISVDELYSPTEGFLWKMGQHLKVPTWRRRWCKLTGNFLYTYRSESANRPTGMICLEDAHVERVDHGKLHLRMKFGMQIYSPINRLKRCFYAASEEDREKWFKALRKAAHQFCFEDFYTINGKVGEGKFANVYSCTRKRNNQKCAVKVINKYDVRQSDRDSLRTEIAVLQFVHHPNVVHLKNVFETRSRMYIVMSLVEGGDLFQRLQEHGRCTEDEARKVMNQLLRALLYLHERGIVHRDLKPENIMLTMKDSLTDIQVVDFGLSKFIAPEEKMNQTCGTLSYLAPEVLLRQGYGREVDMWSAGVILYVMLCCQFPFPDKDMKNYLDKAVNSDFSFNGESWEIVSEDAKSLIRKMLNPNPRQRLTIWEALEDPWMCGTGSSTNTSETGEIAECKRVPALSESHEESMAEKGAILQQQLAIATAVGGPE